MELYSGDIASYTWRASIGDHAILTYYAIDAVKNRRLASFLPGSGVIHGNWTDQHGPLGILGHDALPRSSTSGNSPLSTQQKPEANNVFDSLV